MKRVEISIGRSLACAMLDLTSGMDLPASEAAVNTDRLAAARCRPAGKVTDISQNTLATAPRPA